MAQITVRPVADISKSNINCSSGSSVYNLINEASADGDSTYVYCSAVGSTFTVRLAAPDISKMKTINNVTVYIVSKSNAYSMTINYGFNYPLSGSTSFSDSGSSYGTRAYTLNINKTPSEFNLNDLRIFFTLNANANTAKGIYYVTQMYVVIDYVEKTITAYIKVGDTWKLASAVYVKVDGTWKMATAIWDKITDVWRTG